MTLPGITDSQFVKRDGCFQMQRVVLRGERLLAKVAIVDLGGLEDQLLEQEFKTFHELSSELTLAPVRLERHAGKLTAYYEDFSGQPPFARPTEGRPAPLALAGRLCAALRSVHEAGFVLTVLSPESFLRDPITGHVLVADAPLARRANSSSNGTEVRALVGSHLAYAAPEVIGGTGASVDQRADLYSLGVVLYELLCGHRPFETLDPGELVHCHLAKEPPRLVPIDGALPADVVTLVMKLLAKAPADRPANTWELEGRLLSELGAPAPQSRSRRRAQPARHRASFRASKRLIGRDDVVTTLREKAAGPRSAPALIFIEGEGGFGKTLLLQQARQLLGKGQLCQGRFTQAGSSSPLSAWVSVLRDLADARLTQDHAETERWRNVSLDTLGDGAPIIGLLVPEWRVILGDYTVPPESAIDSGLNRLATAIRALLCSFSKPGAPVVLVLDDLQWADQSSIQLLELVLEPRDPINLLVLVGLRPPVGPTRERSPVTELVATAEASGVEVAHLRLEHWGAAAVEEFLRDSFDAPIGALDALVDTLVTRTRGNPFFVHEFVKVLLERELLVQEGETGQWVWQPEELRRLAPADNVVAFLTRKISDLPRELSELLRLAACIGTTIDVHDLALELGTSGEAATVLLDRAANEGLLLAPLRTARERAAAPDERDSYEFAHDRVYEACRALMTEGERAATCLAIGRRLHEVRTPRPPDVTRRLARYFNVAQIMVTDLPERKLAAELNLEAGRHAKRLLAFSQALDHFRMSFAFLGLDRNESLPRTDEAPWHDDFASCQRLYEEAADAARLNGDLALMHRYCDELLSQVSDPVERVRAYEIRIAGFIGEKRFPEAVATGCEALALVGVRFPARPNLLHAVIGYALTKRRLFAQSVSGIARLPRNVEPIVKASSRIMHAMYSAAYLGHKNLFPLLVYRHINDSLKWGNEDYSCVTYSGFSVVLSAMGKFQDALDLADTARRLCETMQADRHKAKVLMGYYGFAFPWLHPIRDTIPHLADAIRCGIEQGDVEYAGHLAIFHSVARLHTGTSLAELALEFEQQRARTISLRQERAIMLQQLFCQIVHDLREGTGTGGPLAGPHYDAETMLPRGLDPLDHNLVFHHHLAKVMVHLFLGDLGVAEVEAGKARALFEAAAFGYFLGAIFTFWETLLCTWSASTRGPHASKARRRAVQGRRKIKTWAQSAPVNFLHHHHLVEAEFTRARDPAAAAVHYERAIELAQANGFVHDAALAQECAARFYLERDLGGLGRHYLRECYRSYARWGASAVCRRLERSFPAHFAVLATGGDSSPGLERLSQSLDYRALLKAFQTLSAELRLPKLLESLLHTMFEHAGAQRAVLLLARNGELHVTVEADIDQGGMVQIVKERAEESARLCRSVVRYVERTLTPIVLGNATEDDRFKHDPYIQRQRPKSLLCTPLVYQGRLLGIAYLENDRMHHVFTPMRFEIANLLAGQAAISVATAEFHALEVEAQQAKINPHFLFNALSSLAELALQDGERAEEAIVALAELYRYVLATSQGERVTIEQELDMVRRYLALEKLRFGSKLAFSIECDDSVGQLAIPGLLIQPIVENSIRHGIAPKVGGGNILIKASLSGEHCVISVDDDGDGTSPRTAGTGFGLRSVRQRLALFYGDAFTLKITRQAGHHVAIRIPITTESGPASPRT